MDGKPINFITDSFFVAAAASIRFLRVTKSCVVLLTKDKQKAVVTHGFEVFSCKEASEWLWKRRRMDVPVKPPLYTHLALVTNLLSVWHFLLSSYSWSTGGQLSHKDNISWNGRKKDNKQTMFWRDRFHVELIHYNRGMVMIDIPVRARPFYFF